MEKYGFVYIWFDRYRKMYYVGSHWGRESDGYICSSNRMRDAYRRRPDDFKRRILFRLFSSRKELLLVEEMWLSLMKNNELGKKYYNYKNYICGFESQPEKWDSWRRNISEAVKKRYENEDVVKAASDKMKERWNDENFRNTFSEKMKEKWKDPAYRAKQAKFFGSRKGRKLSEEQRKKISEIQTGKKRGPHKEETKAKISAAHTGRVFSEERRKQMSEYRKGRPTIPCSEEKKKKIGDANRGREGHLCNRKLSWDDVCSIRNRYVPRCQKNGTRALGREFRISSAVIQRIVTNKSYLREASKDD